MVLQLLMGRIRRPTARSLSPSALRRVVRHGRRRRTKAEREAKRFSQDASEPASERDVDDEVGRRVDDHQQLADDGQV